MKYVLSLSFGKDSMAMLIEIMKRKLPLDYVIFCDIRFNKDISAEHPLMAEWIPQAEKIIKDKFGIDVIHLNSGTTFYDMFHKKKTRGNNIGQNYGFPYLTGGGWCNSELKVNPIKKFIKHILKEYGAVTEYIGIAKDEPKRLERYKELETKNHKYITLADLDIDELQAFEICKEHNLLSPKYTNSFRSGCWFCNRQSLGDLRDLWKDYPDYFNMLEQMEQGNYNLFRNDKVPLKIRRLQFEKGLYQKKPHKQYSIFDFIEKKSK